MHILRTRRIQLLALTVVVAAIAVCIAIVVSSSGSGSTHAPGLAVGRRALTEGQQVAALLSGIPQHGTRLGAPRAPVTVEYFGDLECPVCRAFTLQGGLTELIERDVRQGRVQVWYRSACTATCNGPGPEVFAAQQVAAYAAGMQHRFWDYAELFYREQGAEGSGYVNEQYLDQLARQIPGLRFLAWKRDRGDPAYLGQLQSDQQSARSLKIPGTPTLFVNGPKRRIELPDAVPAYQELEQAIDSAA